MGTHFYWLALGVLAAWRVTHLLYAEDGPWDLVVRLRRLAGDGFWGALLDCFYCLSLWIAAPFAYWIGAGWKERLLLWPALSAGAILLERVTQEKTAAQTSTQDESSEANCAEEADTQDQEAFDVLWQQQTAVASADGLPADAAPALGR